MQDPRWDYSPDCLLCCLSSVCLQRPGEASRRMLVLICIVCIGLSELRKAGLRTRQSHLPLHMSVIEYDMYII